MWFYIAKTIAGESINFCMGALRCGKRAQLVQRMALHVQANLSWGRWLQIVQENPEYFFKHMMIGHVPILGIYNLEIVGKDGVQTIWKIRLMIL